MHISYHILDFVQQKTKFTMEQPCMLLILHWQYHVYWCPGDLRSQGISRHGIDPQSWNIPSPASEVLITPIENVFKSWQLIVSITMF